MKMDKVAGSGNDEFYTPAYAIYPLLKYLKPAARIWCPFDTEDSFFVQILTAAGHKVVWSHINYGDDYFKWAAKDSGRRIGLDYVVSNPPYSVKTEVIQAAFAFGVPFAFLVGAVGLFESEKRFRMFENAQFELMHFNRRISYLRAYSDDTPALNPPFSSVYLCSGVLPRPHVFETVDKKRVRPCGELEGLI